MPLTTQLISVMLFLVITSSAYSGDEKLIKKRTTNVSKQGAFQSCFQFTVSFEEIHALKYGQFLKKSGQLAGNSQSSILCNMFLFFLSN